MEYHRNRSEKEISKMQTTHSFLDNRSGDWRGCLHTSLRFLRESWDTQWVGLTFVVDACAEFLDLDEHRTDTSAKLLAVARALALQVETNSRKSHSSLSPEEPHYHNRLHFADVLTTVTLQAAIESEHSKLIDTQWQTALILIAIAHDYQHPGRINRYGAEIEQLSVDALRPLLHTHAVPDKWIERIERVILASDFSLVSKNHDRVAGEAFSWNIDWVTVLINEADIMASVLEEFGTELGVALASEWALASVPMHRSVATEKGRLEFLASTLFSSYSATLLGVPNDRLTQLGLHQK